MRIDDLENNLYFRRLSRIKMWPPVTAITLICIFGISQTAIVYFDYVPNLIRVVETQVSPERLNLLEEGIVKIILYMGTWLVALLFGNVLLVYILWNLNMINAGKGRKENNRE